mgnify:CR=1 FL=1
MVLLNQVSHVHSLVKNDMNKSSKLFKPCSLTFGKEKQKEEYR